MRAGPGLRRDAGLLPEATAAERRATLAGVADHWVTVELHPEILDRARRPFPAALHLAATLRAHALVPVLALLSLEERVRRAAAQMGFLVVPSALA